VNFCCLFFTSIYTDFTIKSETMAFLKTESNATDYWGGKKSLYFHLRACINVILSRFCFLLMYINCSHLMYVNFHTLINKNKRSILEKWSWFDGATSRSLRRPQFFCRPLETHSSWGESKKKWKPALIHLITFYNTFKAFRM